MNHPTLLSTLAVLGLGAFSQAQEAPDAQPVQGSAAKEKVSLQSVGPITFGPKHTLFVSDRKAATIHAFDVSAHKAPGLGAKSQIDDVNGKIAALLGASRRAIRIADLAVDPITGQVYLAVTRGQGRKAAHVLLHVGKDGKLAEVRLDKHIGKAKLGNVAAEPAAASGGMRGRRRRNRRMESITDLAYVDGKVVVAGLSNEEFASTLRQLDWPFRGENKGTSVEIYHGAHGKYETHAPVRTFTAYDIRGATHILAAYTCTPLVTFPMSDLTPGKHIKGRTVAELGNRNRPLDMITYAKDGKDFLLIANSARGVMKVPAAGLEEASHIDSRVARDETAGVGYETISKLEGVVELDKLDAEHAIVLVRGEDGNLTLRTVRLP